MPADWVPMFECPVCEKVEFTRNHATAHWRINHPGMKKPKNLETQWEKKQKELQNSPIAVECPFCPNLFQLRTDALSHIRQYHPDKKKQ